MSKTSKQVIVIRKTFTVNGETKKLRTGKYASQCAHSSLKAILDEMKFDVTSKHACLTLIMDKDSALFNWLTGSFTKICVYVETEEELLDVYNKAKANKKLLSAIITDAGRTEFGGVPTKTCCSILGWEDEVDAITGNLKLF